MSAQVYERHLTVENGLAIVIGQDESPPCFAIDFPPAGLIKKLIVKQVGGTAVAFTVDLFSAQVCATHEPGFSESITPSTMEEELARILPQQAGQRYRAVV